MEENVLFTLDAQKIARITLDRPHVHNALDGNTLEQLIEILEQLHKDSSLRAMIFQGNGKSFCAGADIAWMEKMNQMSIEENKKASSQLAHFFHLFNTLPVPTLTIVHGHVRGGGMGIPACSDIVIAQEPTSFAFSEVRIGIVPAIIAPYVITAIGNRQVRRFFLTGEIFETQKALEIGLIHEVVKGDVMKDRISYFIDSILKGGPQAIRKTKSLLHEIRDDSHQYTLKTAKLNAEVRASDECKEGFEAFLNKKMPPWLL